MSTEHKAALAEGREQSRAVRRYLEALEAIKPRRGRKRTPETMQKRLAAIDEALASANPLSRVHLAQERLDLEAHLLGADTGIDLEALEADFVVHRPRLWRTQGHQLQRLARGRCGAPGAAGSRHPPVLGTTSVRVPLFCRPAGAMACNGHHD